MKAVVAIVACHSIITLFRLRELFLNGCKIEEISFPGKPDEKTEQFRQLERFEVANNLLSSWRSVAELGKLASLKTLRINGNPNMTGKFEDVRRFLADSIYV